MYVKCFFSSDKYLTRDDVARIEYNNGHLDLIISDTETIIVPYCNINYIKVRE